MNAEGSVPTTQGARDFISDLLELVQDNPRESFFVLIGMAIVFLAFVVAWKFAPQKNDPNSGGRGKSLFAVTALALLGVACVILSSMQIGIQDGKLRIGGSNPAQAATSPTTAFNRLETNAVVKRLIRLIAYDPKQDPSLSISQMENLGEEAQLYTFVADYDDLKGCTAAEAVYKVGGKLKDGYHVTAIVFPLGKLDLYPASARGVLQVVRLVDTAQAGAADYSQVDWTELLTDEQMQALKSNEVASYAWENWRGFYNEYDAAVQKLKEIECDAFTFIGTLEKDWNSIGVSCVEGFPELQGKNFRLMLEQVGENAPREINVTNFGARVFLVENQAFSKLQGHCLFDFDLPRKQRIPDLGEFVGSVGASAN